jgi:hypothetical protein
MSSEIRTIASVQPAVISEFKPSVRIPPVLPVNQANLRSFPKINQRTRLISQRKAKKEMQGRRCNSRLRAQTFHVDEIKAGAKRVVDVEA